MEALASRTIHYTELVPMQPGMALTEEYNTYCCEVARLLSEGNEGKHVLIKGSTVLGIYPSRNDAVFEGTIRFSLQPFLVHEIQTWEPVIRMDTVRICRT